MVQSKTLSPLALLQSQIKLSNLSTSTYRAYSLWFSWFLTQLSGIPPEDATRPEIIEILLAFRNSPAWSWSKQNTLVNAIKFYFEKCLGRSRDLYIIPNAKRPHPNRAIYSQDELQRIIKGANNLKHRCMLIVLYKSGIRISELLSLTIHDVDSSQMLLGISNGKGGYGRMVPMSPDVLQVLKEYYKQYRPRYWLFPGPTEHRYTPESVRKLLTAICLKVGVKLSRTVHSFRHSFATHHLQQGTNPIYLQKLLGHKNLSTTEIYVHTTPLDLPVLKTNPL